MTDLDFWKSIARSKAQIEICSELNEFLKNRIGGLLGFFGFIRWWDLQEFTNSWLKRISDEQANRRQDNKPLHIVK